ncbi:MAG: hypothetical protein H6531_10410 [Actinobacteria bacterium]|nr:hypothetical protein [Thermoleophilia bacterium]MCB9012229.1 hypothetical protein [Actinomycetota bacterium]
MTGARSATAAALAAAVMLVGCTGSDSDPEPAHSSTVATRTAGQETPSTTATLLDPTAPSPPAGADDPDARAVQETVRRYLTALVEGDGATGCASLTVAAATEFTRLAAVDVGGATCLEVFTAISEQLSDAERDAFRVAAIGVPAVSGAAAEVQVTVSDRTTTVALAREGASWLVSDVPGAETGGTIP